METDMIFTMVINGIVELVKFGFFLTGAIFFCKKIME